MKRFSLAALAAAVPAYTYAQTGNPFPATTDADRLRECQANLVTFMSCDPGSECEKWKGQSSREHLALLTCQADLKTCRAAPAPKAADCSAETARLSAVTSERDACLAGPRAAAAECETDRASLTTLLDETSAALSSCSAEKDVAAAEITKLTGEAAAKDAELAAHADTVRRLREDRVTREEADRLSTRARAAESRLRDALRRVADLERRLRRRAASNLRG